MAAFRVAEDRPLYCAGERKAPTPVRESGTGVVPVGPPPDRDPALTLASQLAAAAHAISRAEPLLLRAQALLLAWLAENRRVDRLSFTAVPGYAEQMLGLERRTVTNRIALHRVLTACPEAEEPFLSGRLTSCQLLALRPVLCRSTTLVDGAEEAIDHGRWLSEAETLTVRRIRERVRRWKDAHRLEDPEKEPEGRSHSFACPRPFLLIWRETIARARQMLGHEAAQWKCLEAVLQETGYAGKGEPRLWSRRRAAGRAPERAQRAVNARVAGTGQAVRTLAEVRKFLEDLTDLTTPTEPRNPVDAHTRLVQIGRLLAPLRVYLGRLLRDLRTTGSLSRLGYPDEKSFLEEELRISERTARNRVSEAWIFQDHPVLARAFCAGEIGTAAAHLIARLSIGRDQRVLIQRSREISLRQFQREYWLMENLRACEGRLGGWWPYSVFPMQGLEEALRKALCKAGWTRKRMNRTFHARGVAPRAEEESQDPAENQALMERLEWMVDRLLLVDWDEPPDPVEELPAEQRQTFSSVPVLNGGTRMSVWLSEEVEADFEAALEEIREVKGESYPIWMGWLTLFLEAVRVWDQIDPTKKPRWSRVLDRDRWRCRAPGCRCRRNLQVHHILFRARGGTHRIHNLIVLCAACHQHLIHEGHLTLQGEALEDLRWALGSGLPDGPLMVMKGERIVWARSPQPSFSRPESAILDPIFQGSADSAAHRIWRST